jgi:ribosome-binding protein aMBF1 (putative translation factor)
MFGRADAAGMITGAQIRAARKLLGWEPFQLAQRAKLHSAIVQRAESGAPPITKYQEALIRNTLEAAGLEFTNGNEPGVKLKATKARKAK